jgi:MoxR-like ATPase
MANSAPDGAELLALQERVKAVEVRDSVCRYLLDLVCATRQHGDVELGVSPRGSLGLFRASQSMALLRGRSYVTPDDVQAVARPVLSHRVQLTAQAKYGGMTPDAIVGGLLGQVPVPT